MFIVVREIDQLSDVPDWLLQIRRDWYDWASAGFMGCLPTNLDDFANTDGRRIALANLGRLALNRIENCEMLPKSDLLIQHWRGYGLQNCFLEVEVSRLRADPELLQRFIRTLRMFILLLEGEVATQAGDNEALPFRWTAA